MKTSSDLATVNLATSKPFSQSDEIPKETEHPQENVPDEFEIRRKLFFEL